MKKYIYTSIVVFILVVFGTSKSFAQNTDLAFTMQFQNSNIHQAVIYPNPVLDFKFKVKSEQIVYKVEVISVIGKTINQYVNKTYSSDDIFVDLEECEKGMYLIKITFEDDEYIIKKLLIK